MEQIKKARTKSKFLIEEWIKYNQDIINNLIKLNNNYQDQIIENKNNISLIKKEFIKNFKKAFPDSIKTNKLILIKKLLLINELSFFKILKELKTNINSIENSWNNISNLETLLNSINLRNDFSEIPNLTVDNTYLNRSIITKIEKENSEYLDIAELTNELDNLSLPTIIEISNKHLFESKIINNFLSLMMNIWLSLSTKKDHLNEISLWELINILANQFNKNWAKGVLNNIIKNSKNISNEEFLKIILDFNNSKDNKVILNDLLTDLDNTINEYKVVLDNVYSRYTLALNLINKKSKSNNLKSSSNVFKVDEKSLNNKYLLDIYNSIKFVSKKNNNNEILKYLEKFYYEKMDHNNNIKFNSIRKICINFYFQKINIQNAIIYQLAQLINKNRVFNFDKYLLDKFSHNEITFLNNKFNEINKLKINNFLLKDINKKFDYIQILLNDFNKMSDLDNSEWFINCSSVIKLIEK